MKIDTGSMKPERVAVLSSAATGLMTHYFGLVNVLHNYDDIAQQPKGFGTGITSGRWFLSLLGNLSEALGGNYNLTFLNGLLFLLLIALCAGLLVSVLGIRKLGSAALVGALLAAFPSAFSTLAFRYTSVYYGIGILLSILAVWVVQRFRFGLLLSALCTALSLSIYQAYVPLTITIFVLVLLRRSLEEDATFKELIIRSLRACGALLLGLALYYILLQIALKIEHTQLSDYQGVNEMGKLSVTRLPRLIRLAVYSVVMLPVKDYCGVTPTRLIKLCYLLVGLLSAAELGNIALQKKKRGMLPVTLLLCAVFPLAVNFIVIMCPDSWIYTIMIYSFVLVPCLPLVLLECLPEREGKKNLKRLLEKGVSIVAAVLVFCYVYQANVNYIAQYYATRQTENYLCSMVTQVRMTEGFTTDLEWAMLGKIDDPMLKSFWRFEMDYTGIEFTEMLLTRDTWSDWIRNYFGYGPELASPEKIEALSALDEVRAMPCWPNQGSIRVIGDTVVIKCQELAK